MTADSVRTTEGVGAPAVEPSRPALPRQRTAAVARRVRRAARQVPGLRRLVRWLRLNLAGVVGAIVFLNASLSPSLLPRTWAYQAAVSGLAATFGYAVGSLLRLVVRAVAWSVTRLPSPLHGRRFRPSRRAVLVAWWSVAVLGTAVTSWFLVRAAMWQTELRLLMGAQSPGPAHYARIVAVSAGGFLVLLAVWRWLRGLARRLEVRLERWVPVPVAVATSVGSVGAITYWAFSGLLLPILLTASGLAFGVWDRVEHSGVSAPASALRSGGPGSLVSWETMNRKGREFLVSGPDLTALQATSESPVREPVRVYVGLDAAPSLAERARLAVAELERAGGFDREVLLIATATGTGWVDPYAASALEYVHGGDTAVVSMQYSSLPSWLSLLSDASEVERAGTVLFDAVHERWAALPTADRPRLLVYGESLGAQGSAGAFADVADVVRRTDGALWVGQPVATRLVSDLMAGRDPGSTVVAPVVSEAPAVRFWPGGAAPPPDGTDWDLPRVLVLSHPSDPVSRWSPRLVFEEPEWLREAPGPDVLPRFTWYPFVTFWQVTADMAVSLGVPTGHGHRYGVQHVDAWFAVAPPPGQPGPPPPERVAELRRAVAADLRGAPGLD